MAGNGPAFLKHLVNLRRVLPGAHPHTLVKSVGPEQLDVANMAQHDILKALEAMPRGTEMPVGLSPFLQQLWDHGATRVFRPEEGVVQYISKNPKAGAIEIGGFHGKSAIPMTDIDIPDPTHPESGITAKTRGHAIEQLERLMKIGRGKVQRVYITPGGVRSFEVGETMEPRKWWKGHEIGDPFYRRFTQEARTVNNERLPATFTFRNSRKANRAPEDDYVAALLGTMGPEGEALPESLRKVGRYHDERIGLGLGDHVNRVRPKVADILDELPSELAEQVKQRYGL